MKTETNTGPAITPAEEVRSATAKLGALRRKMTFVVALSPAEQREHRAAKIGAKTLRTLDNRLAAAKQHPELLPAAFDLGKFVEDTELTSALGECVAALDGICAEVQDTFLAAANRAMVAASTTYNHLKVASTSAERLKRTVHKLAPRTSTTHAADEPEPAEPAPASKPPEAAAPADPPITPTDKAA